MQNSRPRAVFADETPETRQRMQEVFDAFEKLEKELRQHIEQLRVKHLEQVAIGLGLRSTTAK